MPDSQHTGYTRGAVRQSSEGVSQRHGDLVLSGSAVHTKRLRERGGRHGAGVLRLPAVVKPDAQSQARAARRALGRDRKPC